MPQLDFSSLASQMFWLTLVFGTLYFIVSKFIAPKAESILSHRNNYIEDNISTAQDLRDKANALELNYQNQLMEANESVEALQKNTLDIIESDFEEKKKTLDKKIKAKQAHALQEINDYKNQFHDDETTHCISLVEFIIQKLTNKPSDKTILNKLYGNK